MELPAKIDKSTPEFVDAVLSSNDVIFDFSLIENGLPRMPRGSEWDVLNNLFPTQFGLSVVPPMLTIHVRTLPPKPWPLTVAGLPLYITTEEWDTGYDFGKQGVGPAALGHLNAKLHVTRDIFREIVRYFEGDLNIKLDYIQWTVGQFKISVPDDTDMLSVPAMLAGIICHYVSASQEFDPPEAALQLVEPTSTVRDSSHYEELRPGVMLSSSTFTNPSGIVPSRSELYTTSGVLVKDSAGRQFITVASHGYPLGEEKVFHPGPNGQLIGNVQHRLGESDIALARLESGIHYSNETFANVHTPSGTIIRGIRDWENLQVYSTIHMDNPFTGYATGQYIGTRYKRIPSDEPAPELPWVFQTWLYLGQGTLREPSRGSCGSVVLDEEGRAVCFFRWQNLNGHAIGVAATELENFGYTLV